MNSYIKLKKYHCYLITGLPKSVDGVWCITAEDTAGLDVNAPRPIADNKESATVQGLPGNVDIRPEIE
jgi:hypothetical protein